MSTIWCSDLETMRRFFEANPSKLNLDAEVIREITDALREDQKRDWQKHQSRVEEINQQYHDDELKAALDATDDQQFPNVP